MCLHILPLCLFSSLPVCAGSLDDYYLSHYAEQIAGAVAVKSTALAADVEAAAECGTPLKHGLQRDWKLLEAETQKILAKQVASPVLTGEKTYTSAAGHFKVHYAASGTDAPPPSDANSNGVPDWVETVAATFENVYTGFGAMGYQAAPTPSGIAYDVYLLDLAPFKLYGETTSKSSIPTASHPYAYTSWIELDNNFSDSIYKPAIYSPLQNLQVTAAHEYHHAIQYGYNYYFDVWYAEATSTWLEDELYDSVNQLYGYNPAWFTQSRLSLDIPASTVTGGGYGRWIFNRYLSEQYGSAMIRAAWENVVSRPSSGGADIPMVPVLESVLLSMYSTSLGNDFLGFAKRLYTRDWSSHTSDIASIHPYSPVVTYSAYPFQAPSVTLPHYSFAYYKFTPSVLMSNGLNINVTATGGLAAAVFKKVNGTIIEILPDASGQTFTVSDFGRLNPAADEVVLLLANITNTDSLNISFSSTTLIPPANTLTVTLTGTGNGSVHSSPMTDISCSKGATSDVSCSGVLSSDGTLSAVPESTTSAFSGWANACEATATQTDCIITLASMTSDKTAVATFTLVPRSKLDLTASTGYDTLQTAYSNAATTIFALDGLFTGGWTLDQSKNITLKGGYLADYGPTRNGFTVLGGKLTIKNGSLRGDGLKIRP